MGYRKDSIYVICLSEFREIRNHQPYYEDLKIQLESWNPYLRLAAFCQV